MSHRIAEYLARRLGGDVPENGKSKDRPAVPVLTDRGLRTMAAYLEIGVRKAEHDAPIQDMVRGEGWKIIEAEIIAEVQKLMASAQAKMSSPSAQLREEAIFESLIARVYNEGILGRVNRRILDAMLVKDMIQSMGTMREEYEKIRMKDE